MQSMAVMGGAAWAMGVPLYRWMVYEGKNPMKLDDWGYPYDFGNPHLQMKRTENRWFFRRSVYWRLSEMKNDVFMDHLGIYIWDFPDIYQEIEWHFFFGA